MTKQRRPIFQRLTAWLCWFGGGVLLLTAIAFAATAIYEWIVPPTDMHLSGLLTAVIMFYVAPFGGVLLALAGLMRIGGLYRESRKKRQ